MLLLIYTVMVVIATSALHGLWLAAKDLVFAYRVRAHRCTEPGCVLKATFAHLLNAVPKIRTDVVMLSVLLLVTLVGVGTGAHLLSAR